MSLIKRLLDLFNPWQDFGTYYGNHLVYKTTTCPETKKLFITQVKHKQSGVIICQTYGMTIQRSIDTAATLLHGAGVEGLREAVATKTFIVQQYPNNKISQAKKNIENRTNFENKKVKNAEWYDGSSHKHKAQNKIVGVYKRMKKGK